MMIEYFRERKKIILFAVIVMAITLIPYLIGYAQQGEEWRYTGFTIGVEDGNSYLAKMLSGASGNWLFRSPHSAIDQKGVVAFLPYIILGKLAAGTAQHDQLIVLYHLARLVFGGFAILATYDFISIFLKKENLRWWALMLITLGGGLGWILVAISQKDFLGSLPLEFISPESFGFLGIFGFPHLAAARAFFLWGLFLFIKKKDGYLAGILWLIMGFFQPMVVFIAWVVIGGYVITVVLVSYVDTKKSFCISDEFIKNLFVKAIQAVLFSAPIAIYTAYIFLVDPYLKAWAVQNRVLSPHIIHYVIAYGLVLPFTISGVWNFIKAKKVESLLLASWLILSPILIYAPVVTQRRLAEGIWVVLILGLIGNYTETGKIPTAIKGLGLTLLPSTLFIVLGSIMMAANPSEPVFRNIDEVSAYEFIALSAEKDDIVLSSFQIGNNLPAWAPIRVVMGHGPETIGLIEIEERVNDYFNREGRHWECGQIYSEFNVDYLFWGPVEQMTWNTDPMDYDCLTRIYNKGDYSIFEVDHQDVRNLPE